MNEAMRFACTRGFARGNARVASLRLATFTQRSLSATVDAPLLIDKIEHEREACISFKQRSHKYTVNATHGEAAKIKDVNYTSVTNFLSEFKQPFNPTAAVVAIMRSRRYNSDVTYEYHQKSEQEIKQMWKDSNVTGTKTHGIVETLFDSLYDGKHKAVWENEEKVIEIEQAKDFSRFLFKKIEWDAVKTEMRLFDEEIKLAGTCDALFRHGAVEGDTVLSLCDWKIMYKPIDAKSFGGSKMGGPLTHLEDSKLNGYALQLYMYKSMLESRYDMNIANVYLVQLHENLDSFQSVEVPDLSEEVQMLRALRKERIVSGSV